MKYPCPPSLVGEVEGTRVFEIPNCDDPVFRMYCEACGIRPGGRITEHDPKMARLEEMMQRRDPSYDPEQDTADDYLTPRGF